MTAADLLFDAETHTTRTPAGEVVPNVTGILAAVGVATDFAALAEANPRLARAIRAARDRGTAVHADCHALDDEDLDLASVHPAVRPYVDAWVACKARLGLVPLAHARERRVYHPLYGYTGICDGVFLRDGQRVLIDLKTGDPGDAAADLQTAAYASAWDIEHPDEPVDARWAIWLRPGLRVPYSIIDYSALPDAWEHFATFCACLTVFRRQQARRRP